MSETRTIEALMGPFRHSIITIDKAAADKAIKDGWARDPFDNFAERVEVDHAKALAAAEAAAVIIRGEAKPKAETKPAPKEEKQAEAKPAPERGAYETRDVKATDKK